MARGPSTFRQRDLTAAIRAVEKAGKNVLRVEIEPGGKVVLVTSSNETLTTAPNEWDEEP